MQMTWLGIAIAATVGYHVVIKLTPVGANPYLSLAVTYAITTVIFIGVYAVTLATTPGATPLRAALGELNWTAAALAIAVVLLDLGLMMLYRGGFDVSLGQLITQSAGALLLLIVGVAFFAEKLTMVNIGGILLCVIGLWMIYRK